MIKLKKSFSIIFMLLISIGINANGNEASILLEKYGFNIDNVLSTIDVSHSAYSYKSKITSTSHSGASSADYKSVKTYSFDQSKKQGEQYSLLSINGLDPSKKDIKYFNKEKNKSSEQKKALLKKEDFFIISNNENTAIVGFNMPKEELPSKLAYMSHCTGSIYIDKKTGRITKIKINSKEAFSMKIFHVNKMSIEINLAYNEVHKQYYVSSETTKTEILMMGATTTSESREVFSDISFN